MPPSLQRDATGPKLAQSAIEPLIGGAGLGAAIRAELLFGSPFYVAPTQLCHVTTTPTALELRLGVGGVSRRVLRKPVVAAKSRHRVFEVRELIAAPDQLVVQVDGIDESERLLFT